MKLLYTLTIKTRTMEDRKNLSDHEKKVQHDNQYVDQPEPELPATVEEGDEDYDDEELADRYKNEPEASR